MAIVCIFHNSDLDGHCSGAIVRHAIPQALMLGVEYGGPAEALKIIEKATDTDTIIMVDFSLQPFPFMVDLASKCEKLVWIDHHISAISEAEREGFDVEGLRDTNYAACELTWKYFFPEQPIPNAVHLLGRYDVWDLDYPGVLSFQYGMRARNTDPSWRETKKFWDKLIKCDHIKAEECPGIVGDIIQEGEVILRYEDMEHQKYLRRFGWVGDFNGLKTMFLNRGGAGSAAFVGTPPDIPLYCAYVMLPNGLWQVNLYTTKADIDVSQIALANGGGGHKKAAGFITDELPFEVPRQSVIQ